MSGKSFDEWAAALISRGMGVIAKCLLVLCVGGTAHAGLINLYEFNGDFTDTLGNGLALTPSYAGGSTNFSGGSWTWDSALGPGSGLILDAPASIQSVYSIGLRFQCSDVSNFSKIIDFDQGGSDTGFYAHNNQLDLYPVGAGGSVSANTEMDLVVTRDASGNFNAYLDGNPISVYAYMDSPNYAVADIVSGSAQFRLFLDDLVTVNEFSSGGAVNEIRVWDHALTPGEIPGAFAPVPEPASVFALMALGSWALAVRRRRPVSGGPPGEGEFGTDKVKNF